MRRHEACSGVRGRAGSTPEASPYPTLSTARTVEQCEYPGHPPVRCQLTNLSTVRLRTFVLTLLHALDAADALGWPCKRLMQPMYHHVPHTEKYLTCTSSLESSAARECSYRPCIYSKPTRPYTFLKALGELLKLVPGCKHGRDSESACMAMYHPYEELHDLGILGVSSTVPQCTCTTVV